MTQKSKNIFYIFMVLAMAAWGGSWVNAKVLSNYINEYELIFLRNCFTIITLLPIVIITRKKFYINKRSLGLVFIASLVMIAYMKFYFLGTKLGTASLGGALVTTLVPIVTFVLLVLFFGKKILKKDIFALILGAIGVLTILNIWSFRAEDIFTTYNAYFLLAALLWATLTIVSSKATNISPMVFTLYMYIVTTVLVLIFFMDVKDIDFASFDFIFWLNIFSLSVVSTTFATTMYFVGIEKLGTHEVSSFIFLVPFFAITLSAVFLGEKINPSIVIGSILTMTAVKILNNIKIKRSK